jgi:hypothetical protein
VDDDKIIGPMESLTDGVYTWHNDISYYVEHYRIGLSSEFVAHVESSDWVVPEVDMPSLEQ